MRRLQRVAAAVLVALALTACAPDTPIEVDPTATSVGEVTGEGSAMPDVTHSVNVDDRISTIATGGGMTIDVYDSAGGAVTRTLNARDLLTVPDQTPFVFHVQENDGDWLLVDLPIQPNGSTGWIRASDVTLSYTDYWIEISLSEYNLKVWKGTTLAMETTVGVGRADRPTPGGGYYLREVLQLPDPNTVYGPYAYGLSGYQPVLDSFNGGQPIIGIHGTNNADSFGKDVSSGCIRLPNDQITKLVLEINPPLGTPVTISG